MALPFDLAMALPFDLTLALPLVRTVALKFANSPGHWPCHWPSNRPCHWSGHWSVIGNPNSKIKKNVTWVKTINCLPSVRLQHRRTARDAAAMTHAAALTDGGVDVGAATAALSVLAGVKEGNNVTAGSTQREDMQYKPRL